MKKLLLLLAILTFHVQADVTVRIELDAVVHVGKQRGNLFHMLGYYVQLLTKQNYHYPMENLQKDIHEYESIVMQSKEMFSDTAIQNTLDHSQKIWRSVKPELLSVKNPNKTLNAVNVRTLMNHIILLSKDMKKIQGILIEKSLNKEVIAGSQAASDIMVSSAQLSAYYLINTSLLDISMKSDTVSQSMNMYEKALNTLEYSVFSQGEIFKKIFKEFKKVHFFNIMKIEFSKTPVPSLMIKKNNSAYLKALICLKLMAAASVEGVEKTNQMMLE